MIRTTLLLLITLALAANAGYSFGRAQEYADTRHAIDVTQLAIDGWNACVQRALVP